MVLYDVEIESILLVVYKRRTQCDFLFGLWWQNENARRNEGEKECRHEVHMGVKRWVAFEDHLNGEVRETLVAAAVLFIVDCPGMVNELPFFTVGIIGHIHGFLPCWVVGQVDFFASVCPRPEHQVTELGVKREICHVHSTVAPDQCLRDPVDDSSVVHGGEGVVHQAVVIRSAAI